MPSFFIKEKLGFITFFILALLTSILLFMDCGIGLLSFLWGGFGFYRYYFLSVPEYTKLPKALSLPSRILFGLKQENKKYINKSIERLLDLNLILFFFFGMLFVLWGLYCTLYPSEISLIQSYWAGKEDIFKITNLESQNYFIILNYFSYYFIVSLMILIGTTYTQENFLSSRFHFLIFCFFILIGIVIISFNSPISIDSYFNFSYLKGIGWGKFGVFITLLPEQDLKLESGFLRRYVETGLVGAYGLYVVFLPILLVLVRRASQWQYKFMIIMTLLLLFALDFFCLWHSVISSFQVFVLAYIASFWVNAGQNKIKS